MKLHAGWIGLMLMAAGAALCWVSPWFGGPIALVGCTLVQGYARGRL